MCVCVESALQLVYSSKEAGGNPRSVTSHAKVDEATTLMDQAVIDLTATLEKAGGEAGLISGEGVVGEGGRILLLASEGVAVMITALWCVLLSRDA